MDRIRRLIVMHLWWLVLMTALVLLVCHSLGIRRIVVDNTSLILLAVVLISPFVAAVKKVKIGEFEAEIRPDEVMRVANEAEKSLPIQPSDPSLPPETSEAISAIHNLAEADPVVALAKLRIELERRLRRLDDRVNRLSTSSNVPTPLVRLIRDLVSHDVFSSEFGASLRDVISICNRAIHGEDIRDVDARQIIRTGSELLGSLELSVRLCATTHPVEKTVITPQELHQVQDARYRLTRSFPTQRSQNAGCTYLRRQSSTLSLMFIPNLQNSSWH